MLKSIVGIARRGILYISTILILLGNSSAADSSLAPLENSLFNLISRLSQSVVTIEAIQSLSAVPRFGNPEGGLLNLIASGIVYDSIGHILVAGSSVIDRDKVVVIFAGRKIPARVVGVDYQTGLALIKAAKPVGRPVKSLESYRCIGQLVIAIGNSHGMHASPSLGFCAGARIDGSLQFSAAIASGSIGGGVFDLSGRLIGAIIGGIGSGSQAEAGLAVPANKIPAIVDHLITKGDRDAGYLGITISEIEVVPPLEISSPNSLIADKETGSKRVIDYSIVITEVVPFSPAARAGVVVGDLLINFDGEEVYSALDVMYRVRQARSGSVVRLGMVRQNRLFQFSVEIGKQKSMVSTLEVSQYGAQAVDRMSPAEMYQQLGKLKREMLLLDRRLKNYQSQDID